MLFNCTPILDIAVVLILLGLVVCAWFRYKTPSASDNVRRMLGELVWLFPISPEQSAMPTPVCDVQNTTLANPPMELPK